MFTLMSVFQRVCGGICETIESNQECRENEAGAICFIFF